MRVKKSKHGAWQCCETLVPVENFDHFGGSLGTVHDLLRNYDRRDLCSAHWISGTIQEPKRTVNFGLYRNCTESLNDCSGNLNDFSNIYSDAWKASTIFVALAFISTFLSVAIMLLYWLCCFESSGVGFRASSGLQATAGMYYLLPNSYCFRGRGLLSIYVCDLLAV